MEIDEFSRTFFQMEMEERLFTRRAPNGDPFWDAVRLEIYYSLFDEINEPGLPRNPSANRLQFSWLTKIHKLPLKMGSMVSQWTRLKRIRPTDFVAFICSRYKNVNGNPIDFASDDALRKLSEFGSILRVESSGFSPLQDVNFSTLISVAARAYRLPTSYKQYISDIATVIADAERKYFGVTDPHLLNVLRGTYRSHLVERWIWREILDHAQPRLVLMTQNGMQKGLILEARKRHIPIVEFQHGIIHRMHAAYSYPQSLPPGETVILPNALLLFSEHWKRQCCMPGTRLVVVGNNHFANAGALSSRKRATVFISAGPFQSYLSPLAVELAQLMPDRTFIMKLHPSFLSDRAMIEREYQGIPNLVVVGIEKGVPELMDDASDVVIVESTAAYEALDRGVPVHILRKAGYMSHQDLFSRPDVYLFSTAEQLQGTLFKPTECPKQTSRFFDPFDPTVFREVVELFIPELCTRPFGNP